MKLVKQSQFIPLQDVVYFITLPFLVRKIFTFYLNDVLLFKCPFPGTKGYVVSTRCGLASQWLKAFTITTVHSSEKRLPIKYSTPHFNFYAYVN